MTALLRLAASDGWRAALNVALYQAGWFACVLGAANGLPWVGGAAAVAIVVWHLATAPWPGREAALIGAAIVVGALFETLVVRAGWARYPTQPLVAGAAPAWMIALWGLFATMLNVALRAFRDRLALAALLGAIGGPLAYYAGARLGAVAFPDFAAAMIAIAAGWAVAAPLLLALARRFDGFAAP